MINILVKAWLLFITYLFLYLTITVISEKKLKIDIKSLLCISGVILINVYIFKLTNGLLKGFVTFLGFYIYSRIGLSKSLKESIIIGSVMYIYVVVGEILSTVILVVIKLDSFIAGIDNLSVNKLLFSSIYTCALFFITYIKRIKQVLIKLKQIIIGFKYLFHGLICMFFVFEISIIFLLINTSNQFESILSVALIIIITLGVSTIIYSHDKNSELKLLNENLKVKNESFLKVLQNYKMFKHNMKHELNAISSIGSLKVKNLVNEYIKEYEIDNNLNIDDIIKIPNGIRGIMYEKIIESKDIPCNISVDNSLSYDPFEYLNITKQCKLYQCLGIIFDNAIEAAKECENGFVYIRLYESNNSIFMEFSNNFINNISIDDASSNEQSTKQNHYGIGLTYLAKQKEFKIQTKIRNNIYTQVIKIC